ncbi:unnamed protein product [Eruca vesicaria subsp. sativa]|uniref:Uncharacterized protein n=1 Tax=Eruca vesicaria subsp. sativa TaxID=29727 RepID=A0ABC8KGX5_ERUVS|nr:unnamed protein product [Eruca vesicaria subsp. sativa]
MESRRNPRAVVDPKVRQVSFFTSSQPYSALPPDPIASDFHPASTISPSRNSLSPVMIPPPRHNFSDTFPLCAVTTSAVSSSFFFYSSHRDLPDGSMKASPGRVSMGSFSRSSLASSLPGVGMDSMAAAKSSSVPASVLTTVSLVNMPPMEVQSDQKKSSKPLELKEKTTKAERRALQEAQRAAKVVQPGHGFCSGSLEGNGHDGGKAPLVSSSSAASTNVKAAKPAKPPSSQKNDLAGPSEKDRKKDAPHPACNMMTRVES